MDKKTLDILKNVIRKQISEVKDSESPRSMHEMGVALTKAASSSLKTLEALRSKAKMPSKKAQEIIDRHIIALEQIFNDMWQSPLSYLDATPEDVVSKRRSDLDNRESSLIDHAIQEGAIPCGCANDACEDMGFHMAGSCKNPIGRKKSSSIGSICDKCAMLMPLGFVKESSKENTEHGNNPNLLSHPTHCDTCGSTFDAKLHKECPSCCNSDVKESLRRLKNKISK